MADKYSSFRDLAANEKRGEDYELHDRAVAGSKVVVIAPHAGTIEPRTHEIAMAIAGNDFSYYWFKALKPGSGLHLPSHRFDEPTCVALVSRHPYVVSIHGWETGGERVCAGGLDETLKKDLRNSLATLEIELGQAEGGLRALDPLNITNRGSMGRGVQLELSMDFRKNRQLVGQFCEGVRRVLLRRQASSV